MLIGIVIGIVIGLIAGLAICGKAVHKAAGEIRYMEDYIEKLVNFYEERPGEKPWPF